MAVRFESQSEPIAGYRLLDTAVNYGNEEEVGEAVRRSGLARDEVQVTSKIPGRHHAYDLAIGSVEESLRHLRFDYLDRFAAEHRIAMISVAQLVEHRLASDLTIAHRAPAPLLL